MPFQALPFANRSMAQQMKSVFGVRGIPSLVLIDSISGTDNAATSNTKAQSYLQRKKDSADGKQGEKAKPKVLPSTEESAAHIKEIFTQLVAKGMKPNEAAVAAIKQATNVHNNVSVPTKFEEGVLQGTSERCVTEMKQLKQ